MKRIALYARTSTVDRGQDPEVELRELRAWAARLGAEVVAEYVWRARRQPALPLDVGFGRRG